MQFVTTRRRVLGWSVGAAVTLAVAGSWNPANAAGDAVAGRIEAFYGVLLDCMKNAKTLGTKGRFDKLAPVVAATFDTPLMAKSAVGPAWDGLQPAQQTAIVDAFTRMTTANYASSFDGFNGEKFEVGAATDQPPGDKLVASSIVRSNGKPVPINYLMRNSAGGWKVVDVYLDGTISKLAGQRAEFGVIVKAGGADALVTALKAKTDKLLASGG